MQRPSATRDRDPKEWAARQRARVGDRGRCSGTRLPLSPHRIRVRVDVRVRRPRIRVRGGARCRRLSSSRRARMPSPTPTAESVTRSSAGLSDLSSETASNRAVAAARTLVLDAVAIECIAALRAEDIRVILLKGPVTDRWLYSDGGLRDYIDVDLLVPRGDFRVALKTLERLGF